MIARSFPTIALFLVRFLLGYYCFDYQYLYEVSADFLEAISSKRRVSGNLCWLVYINPVYIHGYLDEGHLHIELRIHILL